MIKKCVRFNLDANTIHLTYSADEYDRSYISALILVPLLKLRADAVALAEQHKTMSSGILPRTQPNSSLDVNISTVPPSVYTSLSPAPPTPPAAAPSMPSATLPHIKRRRPKITPLDLSMIPNAKRRYPPPSIYDFTATTSSTIDELSC